MLSAESDFIFYEPFLPLFLVIPAIERPDDPSGEAEELRLSIDATLDPPSAGQVDGNRVVLSSFPVVVTGTLPTRDFSTLPDFFEWVSVAEGEFYFSYVFLEDAYGNLLWSEVMRVRSNEDCER